MNNAGVDIQVLLWAIGILVTINMLLLGFIGNRLWIHVVECHSILEKVASIWNDVERMKQDIGTHQSGLRGSVHLLETTCAQHELRIALIEKVHS